MVSLRMPLVLRRSLFLLICLLGFASVPALAQLPESAAKQTVNGYLTAEPIPYGIGMQPGVSPVRTLIDVLYADLTYVITAITLFVLALLVWVVIRYNHRANPVPSTRTHHVKLEIVWTLVPVLILAIIAIPSFTLLYYEDRTPNPELTLKVTGHQWYWSYEYPDNGDIGFDARPIWVGPQTTAEEVDSALKDAKPGWLIDNGAPRRLLEVDNRVVLPIDTNIRVLIAGADVIHSWSLPAMGIKRDAVPGHLNETWMRIDREGVYYGQCSQICGAGHAFMPIVVEAVTKDKYKAWVAAQHAKGNGAEQPAQPVSDSAQATEKTIKPLSILGGGGEAKPAPMVDPSKGAKPDVASEADKSPDPTRVETDDGTQGQKGGSAGVKLAPSELPNAPKPAPAPAAK